MTPVSALEPPRRLDAGVLDAAARAAAAAGVERWEIRATDSVRNVLNMDGKGEVSLRASEATGFGVRVFREGGYGFAYSTEWTNDAARRVVADAVDLARHLRGTTPPAAARPAVHAHRAPPARRHPRDLGFDEKVAFLREVQDASVAAAGEGGKGGAVYGEDWGTRIYRDSEGCQIELEPLLVHATANVLVPGASGLVGGSEQTSRVGGLEVFAREHAPAALAERAARNARDSASARKMPAGRFRALLDPGLAGVLAHESFGHLSEYDLVESGWSVLRGRLGETLGSKEASICDSGIMPDARAGGLWFPFDDEGVPTETTSVLDRGVLASFLHNRTTAAIAGQRLTGNGRVLHHGYAPLVRMRNTYFTAGDLAFEEALEELGDGYLACGSRGGVPRSDGTFTFVALRGYRVEGGKIAYPVKGVTLVGNILDLLHEVAGRTRDIRILSTFFGGCGKWQQNFLPVGYGGPHVLLDEAVFGGDAA